MPKFLVRLQTLVDREIEAFDIASAERQAKFIAGGLRFTDSDGDPQHASLYSVEEIKEAAHVVAPNPFAPRPQRRFVA